MSITFQNYHDNWKLWSSSDLPAKVLLFWKHQSGTIFINSFMPLDNYSMCNTACFIDLKRKGMFFLGFCMSPTFLPSPDLYSLVCKRLQTWGRETLQALWTGEFSLSLSFVGLSGEVYLPPGITTTFLEVFLPELFLLCLYFSISKAK